MGHPIAFMDKIKRNKRLIKSILYVKLGYILEKKCCNLFKFILYIYFFLLYFWTFHHLTCTDMPDADFDILYEYFSKIK